MTASFFIAESCKYICTLSYTVALSLGNYLIQILFSFPVKALISHGVDIHATESNDWTALMWAAKSGNMKIVEVRF